MAHLVMIYRNRLWKKTMPGYKAISLLTALLHFFSLQAQPPIGQWRTHLPYQQAAQVVKGGNSIFCAAGAGLFAIDSALNVTFFSKTSGLNDVNVQKIAWDNNTRQLVVAYANSNLDIIAGKHISNIGDIRRSTIAGNKTIRNIFCSNGTAYLATGLGIVTADLSRYEIKDTWIIGNNGNSTGISNITEDGSNFYAATDEGLKRVPKTVSPADYRNWISFSGILQNPVQNVITTDNRIIVQKNDSLLVLNNNTPVLFYYDAAWSVVSINASENRIVICQRNNAGNGRVLVLRSDGSTDKTVPQQTFTLMPRAAITDNTSVWIADSTSGLLKYNTAFESYVPDGPGAFVLGDLLAATHTIYAAAGTVSAAFTASGNKNGVFAFRDNEWLSNQFFNKSMPDSLADLHTLAADPLNGTLWAGSYGGGLLRYLDGQVYVYKNYNSSLLPAFNTTGDFRIGGLAFDQQRNLWVSNSNAVRGLHVRKADSSWQSFSVPVLAAGSRLGQVVADEAGQLWIVAPGGNGLICYNPGSDISNTADDRWKQYLQGAGMGNLPGNNALCLLKDKNGFIWVGTDQGIGIIRCASAVFDAQGCDAILPVVQQDRFAGLLFRNETVQCMAADGADRKWVGTKNGVWLLSPDGLRIIYRFDESNSPLLGNDVKRIAVDPVTGEVFMATNNGLCSFRSTATEGAADNRDLLVFPNPVPPGYNGTIAIRGLVTDALVKITELNGKLVYQVRSLGGQATWNGRNYKGEKVASGIYLVLVRDDSGNERIAGKIAITSGR
ncbi:type IX secretion system anionic LPS delivery protein PorZ [Sediminibacterium ginsengisoli]|nr:two-component regulator propeller domain-containing protein [Sediminibacterium ginsengisoli]